MTRFQNSMAAAAFAESGEFDTAREILKAEDETRKKVILGINDLDIKPQLVRYAHELSKRVGGQLEVLQILTAAMVNNTYDCMHNSSIEAMREMGIAYKIVIGLGTIEDELIMYTREKRNILLVLLKSICDRNKTMDVMQIMDKLNCPVVVFSEMV